MNDVASIEQLIRDTEAQLSTMSADHAQVVDRARAEIAEVDALLAPLDEEVRRGLSDGSRHAEHVRAQRRALLTRRAAAEAAGQQWGRTHGDTAARLRRNLNDWRRDLEHARFAALADTDLERDLAHARFNLTAARGEVIAARDGLEHYRTKLAQAHGAAEAEEDAVHALAELNGEREALEAAAFVSERPADPAKLADLAKRIAAADRTLEQLKRQATGARAALGSLDECINVQQAKVDEALERVANAEAAVLAAVRNRAIRQIAATVEALRAPLLTLEAADADGGFRLYRALVERGPHVMHVDGTVEVPDWVHSVHHRPDGYREAIKAARRDILAAGGATVGEL